MPEHYFSAKPTAKHRPQEFKTVLRGREYWFRSDTGVFSRGEIDLGTRLLIESLDLSGVSAPLDLGCGYGPIGLSLAGELPEVTVSMSDPNERAVTLARINATRNRLTNVEIEEGEDFLPWGDRLFDLIVTNPPLRTGKEMVLTLFWQAKERLIVGGSLWAVIRTKQGAKSYLRELEKIFGQAKVVEIQSGYRVLKADKR